MRYLSLFIILLLAFGAAAPFNLFGSTTTSSPVQLAPTITGSRTVSLCNLITYRFWPAGATSYGLKSTNVQAQTTKTFNNLPLKVNFFWGPNTADMGTYVMQAYADYNGVKTSYGPTITVTVGPRMAGTGSECPYQLSATLFGLGNSAFASPSTSSVIVPTYGFADGMDTTPNTRASAAKSSVQTVKFGFKAEEEGYDFVYSGVVAIGLGFLLVALYYYTGKK